jgi:hypothetical protein
MIKVTDVAMKELKAMMDRGRTACVDEFKEISYGVDESNIALRLVLTPDGYLAIIMDVYREGDTVIEDNCPITQHTILFFANSPGELMFYLTII